MKINSENIEKQIANLLYEKPSFNKYGTMKELTFGQHGSPGDGVGSGFDPTINDNQSILGGDLIGGNPTDPKIDDAGIDPGAS